jgi:hypothetical protein
VSLAAFTWTTRARPVVELGVGDSRIPTGQATWSHAYWDTDGDRWAGNEPTWHDITCDTISLRCEYGRRHTTDRFVPGLATVVVNNETGWADPNAVGDPTVLTIRPGRPIRFGVVHAVYGTRWLYRGFVDAVVPQYVPNGTDTVQFDCVDALGEVNRGKLIPQGVPIGDGEPVSTRLNAVLDQANWPAVKRDIWPTSIALVGDEMGGQVADLLTRAADSGGGVVFGDLEANVAFRPRDWQVFAPDEPVDGTIGNVDMIGTPGVPAVPGYLTPTIGTVTTLNPGPLPADCTFVFKVRGPATATYAQIAAQLEVSPLSWTLALAPGDNVAYFISYPDGATPSYAYTVTPDPTGGDELRALSVQRNNGSGRQVITERASIDGGTTWTQVATADFPTVTPAVSPNVVRIGQSTFDGRVYSVELRTGLDPKGGTVVWRFDADEYPGGTSYADPRGRTWTLTAPNAITPTIPAVPAVPPDVCPVAWERPFARADMATLVILGRDAASAVQVEDPEGQVLYGIEPFEQTDLLTKNDGDLLVLANRILRTRSATSAPRVRSVTLDARTADGALDLMSTVSVWEPSRYRCRLRYPRGDVFDAEHFATGAVHELDAGHWTLNLNLDLADPFRAVGGRWDGAYWDQALWADVVAIAEELLLELDQTRKVDA